MRDWRASFVDTPCRCDKEVTDCVLENSTLHIRGASCGHLVIAELLVCCRQPRESGWLRQPRTRPRRTRSASCWSQRTSTWQVFTLCWQTCRSAARRSCRVSIQLAHKYIFRIKYSETVTTKQRLLICCSRLFETQIFRPLQIVVHRHRLLLLPHRDSRLVQRHVAKPGLVWH